MTFCLRERSRNDLKIGRNIGLSLAFGHCVKSHRGALRVSSDYSGAQRLNPRQLTANEEAPGVISLVTVCFNNPVELEKTVASVRLQTNTPDHYVVVDSSEENLQPRMREIALSANASYVWVPPTGVYAAMRESMKHVPDDSWVWWINSSDWLAGQKSIEIVLEAITAARANNAHWIVGELLRYKNGRVSQHHTGDSGVEFLKLLQSGRTGFPHPSTIFRASSLKTIAAYDSALDIASDYLTALRFGSAFGPPLLLPASIAVHDPTGLTSRHPVRNFWERSRARIAAGSPLDAVFELWRFPRSAVRGLNTRVAGEKEVQRSTERLPYFPLRGNEAFDESEDNDHNLNLSR